MDDIKKRRGKYVVTIPGLLVGLTIIYCTIFPGDKMNIKEIILFFTLLVCSPYIYKSILEEDNAQFVFFSIIYPLLTILISVLIGDTTVGNALSYGYVWVYLLLIPAIVELNLDIKKPFVFATTVVALMIDFIALTDILGIISFNSNPLLFFFSTMNELQYGKGVLSTFGYSIFFKGSPLIVITYSYMMFCKRYLHAAFLFLAMMFCGTRANFIVALIITAGIPVFCNKKQSKKIVSIFIIVAVAALVLPDIVERLSDLNSIKYDRSESIKIDAVYSIFNYMNQEPIRYIFGSGIGSLFFSAAKNKYVSVIEVSYFDYFRQVGIVGFSFFLYFIIRPIKYYLSNEKWFLFAYLGYLAIAFTNPLLVTSTSFVVYILAYSCAFESRTHSLFTKNGQDRDRTMHNATHEMEGF